MAYGAALEKVCLHHKQYQYKTRPRCCRRVKVILDYTIAITSKAFYYKKINQVPEAIAFLILLFLVPKAAFIAVAKSIRTCAKY